VRQQEASPCSIIQSEEPFRDQSILDYSQQRRPGLCHRTPRSGGPPTALNVPTEPSTVGPSEQRYPLERKAHPRLVPAGALCRRSALDIPINAGGSCAVQWIIRAAHAAVPL